MSDFVQSFTAEAVHRFRLDRLEEKYNQEDALQLAKKYASGFYYSDEVREKYTSRGTLVYETALHCYHAGVIVALYYLTEEDYSISEKTFAVLNNMDSVFFAELMFTRWNVKKRYVAYKTDFMAESLLRLVYSLGGDCTAMEDEILLEAMTLIFLCGFAADIPALEDPYADLEGLPDLP